MSGTADIDTLIAKLANALGEHLARYERDAPLMVGVHTGGVWVAKKLHELLAIEAPLGTLNINFYRDDFTRIGMHPMVTPSDLFSVDDRHVVLIDDVLHTGRTIRAALNEIFDYGLGGLPAVARLGRQHHPMRQDRNRQLLEVVGARIAATVEKGTRLGGAKVRKSSPRADTQLEQPIAARRGDQLNTVLGDLPIHLHLAHRALHVE